MYENCKNKNLENSLMYFCGMTVFSFQFTIIGVKNGFGVNFRIAEEDFYDRLGKTDAKQFW